LGMLAVGLGVGAAVAHSPVASADPFSFDPNDIAISFDGHTLFHEGNATADTTTGDYSLAIADGNGAGAFAYGTDGSAFADGSDANAISAGGTGDVAVADGTEAVAWAGGQDSDTNADDDTAIDIGNNASTGIRDGAFAGNSDDDGGTDGGTGSDDTAIDIGNNTEDGSLYGYSGAFAGAGGLLPGGSGDGNNDTAIDVGNNSGNFDGSFAQDGNGNYASESGSITGTDDEIYAGIGNDNTAVGDTSYNASLDGVYALEGNDNYASVLGPDNSYALAGYGDSNIAYVLDPFGSTTSGADADGFNSDLAAVLFTDGTANAGIANDVYDILTAFGPLSGTF